MLTVLIVLAVRAIIVLAVIALVVGVALFARRRLQRNGKWSRVQELARSSPALRADRAPAGGARSVATRLLHRWLDGGTNQ